ncbi:unnamed protein product, partial [Nesidiocoris tenuis]
MEGLPPTVSSYILPLLIPRVPALSSHYPTGFILMRHYPVRPRYVSATQLLFEIDEGFLLVMLMCFDFFFIADKSAHY